MNRSLYLRRIEERVAVDDDRNKYHNSKEINHMAAKTSYFVGIMREFYFNNNHQVELLPTFHPKKESHGTIVGLCHCRWDIHHCRWD